MSLKCPKEFCYLGKEHSFIHVSPRESHCPSKSLKVMDSRSEICFSMPGSLNLCFFEELEEQMLICAILRHWCGTGKENHNALDIMGELKHQPVPWYVLPLAWAPPLLSSWWPWESEWGAWESEAWALFRAGNSSESGAAEDERAESCHTTAGNLIEDQSREQG